MHRLLIVDDEPAIVEGLVQLFQEQDELELDICKAYSAIEAVELVKKTKIDIVLSDIRMPGKSGLQMIDEILYYWPSCRIIFLTGFSDFNYVYTAIQKNVETYILKTEDDSVVIEAVKGSIKKINEERRNSDIFERAQKQSMLMGPLLKKELFEALLSGETVSGLFSEGYFAEYPITLDMKLPVLILVGSLESWTDNVSYEHKLNVYYSIANVFRENLNAAVEVENIIYEHSMLVWFIQPSSDADRFRGEDGKVDWRVLITYLKGVLESLQITSRDLCDVDISFVISREAVEWNRIDKEFETVKAFIKKRVISGQAMTILDLGMPNGLFTDKHANVSSTSSHEFNNKLNLLEKSLDDGDGNQAETVCRDMIHSLKQDFSQYYFAGIERYYKFLLAFLSYINDQNMSDKLKDEMHVEHFAMMDMPIDWEMAETYFVRLARLVCAKKKEEVANGEHILVERIHHYVQENIGGDLSLARIAETVYLNPSYLSRFYKRLTGRNLSDYIHSAKAKAALGMLADTRLKINEIALKLGYESPSYFTAFFRKMTGKSPQEYREVLLHKR